jgi:hypothetical protein
MSTSKKEARSISILYSNRRQFNWGTRPAAYKGEGAGAGAIDAT